ncbi:MAG: TIGR03032 family protein [Flavobacteriales bacterium]
MNPSFDITYSPELPSLLEEWNICILLTTYQAGKMIIISSQHQQLTQTPISLKKPMGIALEGSKMAIACIDEMRFFSKNENSAPFVNDEQHEYDAIYLQRAIYQTGVLDIHDLSFGDGMIWGVNTMFSCLAVFDINYSFRPKWKPPFISQLVPEDRCHLNGMVLKDGVPKYVTALSQDDERQGWRKNKLSSGILMEVPTGEIVLSGLSMPHSPRFYNEELFFLESGSGSLIKANPVDKSKELVYQFNCFIRGLSFYQHFAIIGKSQIRATSSDFNDLPIKENSKNAGFIIFCMKTKSILGELNYTSDIQELFDVQIIDNTKNAVVIPHEIEQMSDIITFPGHVFKRVENSK